ncbi:MAG TPA: hypothetical protein VMM93_10475 [Vicinamibacterales bacterium]|nr:hypothetical protein [Vicinamibacterales bacterium]
MATHGAGPAPDLGTDLSAIYIRVLVLEAVVLAALVWLGWHFA